MGKNSFVLYDDEYDFIKLLSFEERGKLLTAIYEYRTFGESSVLLSEAGAMLFQVIKNHLNRDAQKYVDKCEKNKENALKRIRTQANASERKRIKPIMIMILKMIMIMILILNYLKVIKKVPKKKSINMVVIATYYLPTMSTQNSSRNIHSIMPSG